MQPNNKPVEVPIISGNSIRGILRDAGMFAMCRKLGYGIDQENGKVNGLPLQAFYFLFSGGALVSTGKDGLDVDYFREMKKLIPLIGIFGGAAGNAIMPGKLKVGQMIPLCRETEHLIPKKFKEQHMVDMHLDTIWEYIQTDFYTRRDDAKNDRLLPMLEAKQIGTKHTGMFDTDVVVEEKKEKAAPQQMMYEIETLAAGTSFYWEITLEDVNDIEFEAFLSTIMEFSKNPYIGGKSAVGHGKIAMQFDKWIEVDSRANINGKELDMPLMQKYEKHLNDNGDAIRYWLNKFGNG